MKPVQHPGSSAAGGYGELVTRIIAGAAGSLSIAVPGVGTRPTGDRVREAIFSALDARGAIRGSSVVDLYAGSGALGLEMASRGAGQVALVEKSPRAGAICRRNAATVSRALSGETRVDVAIQAVESFLSSGAETFDVAFLDPPYDLDESSLARDLELLAPRLADDAIVLVERGSRSPPPRWPDGIELERRKDYGDTTLWWARQVTGRASRPTR